MVVVGTAGSGVTRVLRDTQDGLASHGSAVLCVSPRAVSHQAMWEQLAAPLQLLLRSAGRQYRPEDIASGTPRNSDALDDLAVVTRLRHVVLCIDDVHLCDSGELDFLRRVCTMYTATGRIHAGWRCDVFCGGRRSIVTELARELHAAPSHRHVEDLPVVSAEELRALTAGERGVDALSRVACQRLLREAQGSLAQCIALLRNRGRAPEEAEGRSKVGHARTISHGSSAGLSGLAASDTAHGNGVSGLGDQRCGVTDDQCGASAPLWEERTTRVSDSLAEDSCPSRREREQALRCQSRNDGGVEQALALLGYVESCGSIPVRLKWPTCKELLRLLRAGYLGEVESFGRTIKRKATIQKRPWWLEWMTDAAASERRSAGKLTTGEWGKWHKAPHTWQGAVHLQVVARALWKRRQLGSARTILEHLCNRPPGVVGPIMWSVLEDYAIVSAELGNVRTARLIATRLLKRARQGARTHREGESLGECGVPGSSNWIRVWRIKHRVRSVRGLHKSAARAALRETRACGAGWLLRRAASLNNVGVAAMEVGVPQEAVARFNESIELRTRIDDERGMLVTHTNLALALLDTGNRSLALSVLARARLLARHNGLQMQEHIALLNMATALATHGRIREARRHLWYIMSCCKGQPHGHTYSRAVYNYAKCAIETWHCSAAERWIGELQREEREHRVPPGITSAALHAVLLARKEASESVGEMDGTRVSAGERGAMSSDGSGVASVVAERVRTLCAKISGRVRQHSLLRVSRIARQWGVRRPCLNALVAAAGRMQLNAEAVSDVMKELVSPELCEGNDDLHVRCRMLLSACLFKAGDREGAQTLAHDALLRVQRLERKMRGWMGSERVLDQCAATASQAREVLAGRSSLFGAHRVSRATHALISAMAHHKGTQEHAAEGGVGELLSALEAAPTSAIGLERTLDRVLAGVLRRTGAELGALVTAATGVNAERRVVTMRANGEGVIGNSCGSVAGPRGRVSAREGRARRRAGISGQRGGQEERRRL